VQWADEGGKTAALELATRMLTAWTTWKRPGARILAVEHQFELTLAENLPPLVGRVDLVEEHPDHVLLLDVKTARSRWSAQQVEEHAAQLVLYRLAIEPLAKELGKPVKLGWEIITKGKVPQVERIIVDQPEDATGRQVKIAQEVVRAIEAGIFIPMPGWACASCPWAGPCRDWGK
jgi:CRISPR/Cas system-associated exonuclease Cas4 (RecB family)